MHLMLVELHHKCIKFTLFLINHAFKCFHECNERMKSLKETITQVCDIPILTHLVQFQRNNNNNNNSSSSSNDKDNNDNDFIRNNDNIGNL